MKLQPSGGATVSIVEEPREDEEDVLSDEDRFLQAMETATPRGAGIMRKGPRRTMMMRKGGPGLMGKRLSVMPKMRWVCCEVVLMSSTTMISLLYCSHSVVLAVVWRSSASACEHESLF